MRIVPLSVCWIVAGGCTAVELTTTEDTAWERPVAADTNEGDREAQDSGVGDTDSGESPRLEDDSRIVESQFPREMECREAASASVTVRNTGRATWTRDGGYKLGTVDDEDPLHASTRVYLEPGDEVAPGEIHTFQIQLQAPGQSGAQITDWQMVHEGVRWFGGVHENAVQVTCAAPNPEPAAPDLNSVQWLHSDVSGWPETGTLHNVSFSGDQICMDYDKADVWPIYDLRGTDVVGNPWIFIHRNGQWYAGTWEWLRPGQTCKSVHSVAGDHIKRSPFDEASGWVPQSGEVYYFMISGLGRFDERNVLERTNLVRVVWP